EEELGDEEIEPGVDLVFEVRQVGLGTRRFWVFFGVTRAGQTKVVMLTNETDELGGVAEAAFGLLELRGAAGRVAPERQHVADPARLQLVEHLRDFGASGADAGEVSHGLDPHLALDALDQIDRETSCAAAGAV